MATTTITETAAQPASSVSATAETPKPQATAQAALATGGYEFPGIPRIDDLYKKRQWQLEHMAGAFRVFARKGYTEGTSGHISVRDPVDPSTFWINPYAFITAPSFHLKSLTASFQNGKALWYA